MPVYALGPDPIFPDPRGAHASGVVAVGGDLAPERLIAAYSQGIFPWPQEGYPLLWHSPPARWLIDPKSVVINRTLAKVLRRQSFDIRLDTAFAAVIEACAAAPRPGQDGTWINGDMVAAYTHLHQLGWAHSVEAWQDGCLVGGLYGVSVGAMFCGESMFAQVDNASKVALVTLCAQVSRWQFLFVDAQVHTPHMERLGATRVTRGQYLKQLAQAVAVPHPPGPWRLDADLTRGPTPSPAGPAARG